MADSEIDHTEVSEWLPRALGRRAREVPARLVMLLDEVIFLAIEEASVLRLLTGLGAQILPKPFFKATQLDGMDFAFLGVGWVVLRYQTRRVRVKARCLSIRSGARDVRLLKPG